jgi:hypothetical protein
MNKGNIHTEILCDIKYISNKYISGHIYELINKVERINSYCVGGEGNYVLSAYKKNVSKEDLLKIIMEHIYENIANIKSFKIKIWKYDKKGKRIKN